MDSLIQNYLNDLKSDVYQMAGLVEESIVIVTKAITEKDGSTLHRVFDLESRINEYHKKIDHSCFKFLARQSPVAGDLRWIVVIIKMGVDLERMGDLSCSITHCLKNYFNVQPIPLANEVPKMSDLVRMMVSQGIEAFMKNDETLARKVLVMDDQVDEYCDFFGKSLRSSMKQSSINLDAALEIFNIIRSLERIGDHATNIAEEVVFLTSGEDIRHQKKLEGAALK